MTTEPGAGLLCLVSRLLALPAAAGPVCSALAAGGLLRAVPRLAVVQVALAVLVKRDDNHHGNHHPSSWSAPSI